MLTYSRKPADLFQRRFNRLFDDWARERGTTDGADEETEVGHVDWRPAVDIRETDDHVLLLIDLPGIGKDGLELTVEENVLRVRAERPFPDADKDSYRRVERRYGVFGRTFSLPRNIDQSKVEAHFDNGVLTIELPKAETAKPRRIEIG
ncbi:MAG: Hsp20/alpha crystallin family protein [Acidobacteriota bacterium]